MVSLTNQESALLQVREKWDTFLGKIQSRLSEFLVQAEAITPKLLAARDFDTNAYNVAWQGIESQAIHLISRIEDTWFSQVLPELREIEADEGEPAEVTAGNSEHR